MKLGTPNITKILTDARAAGWRIEAKDGEVIIVPSTIPADGAERKRIADAVARVARRHVGYCYKECV